VTKNLERFVARRQSRPPAATRSNSSAAGGRSLTPFYIVLGLVAVVGIGFLLSRSKGGGAGNAALAPTAVEVDPAEMAQVKGISIGRDDAPVVIYEFADFQCPGCGQFATFVTPLIRERLVEPGLVRFVYYDFPLAMHPYSFLASRAARCANEQGKFWEYSDVLYGRQPRWSIERSAPVASFIEYAGEIGLDRPAFEACLKSDRYADEVTRNLRLGESLHVQGTPTLFINGKQLSGIPDFAQLEKIVRDEAGSAAPAGPTIIGLEPDSSE
jgi:protein-disulfide isomerase